MDFDAADLEDIEHFQHGRIIVLDGGDDEGVRLALLDRLDRILVHPPGVEEEFLLVEGGRPQQAERQRQLVVDDVPQPPPAARPGVGELDPFLGVGRRDLRRFDVDGRGQPDRGHFAQQAENVVEPGRVVAGADVPAGEAPAVDDALEAVLLEVEGHVGSDEVDAPPDERLDVGDGRVHERRDEQAGFVGAHLVLVEVNLGEPVMVQDLVDGPGFREVGHEPVAVVVVAGVIVIQPGHFPALEFRPEVFLVPVDFHLVAVGIGRRDEEEDDVPEDRGGVERACRP